MLGPGNYLFACLKLGEIFEHQLVSLSIQATHKCAWQIKFSVLKILTKHRGQDLPLGLEFLFLCLSDRKRSNS